ncbi:MAG: DUF6270 domain-containing protein [Corynebacterium casei]|uniref:DUF6270 domain-containing protein n=1 Tax=Corynebacterium casei TaxID=160386 RepID=UPI003F9302A7
MAIISNNLKFFLPVSESGEATISGVTSSPTDVHLNILFGRLSPKIPREGLTLLPDGMWSLQLRLRAGETTRFNETIQISQLAGGSVPITISLPENVPSIYLRIDQWATDATIFVHGGCVSRDAFEFTDAPPLSDYRARSSLVSGFDSTPADIPDSALLNNSSSFQRRMLKSDIDSEVPRLLATHEFDYFLIDLIIERSNLGETASGGRVTISPEFIRTGLSSYAITTMENGSPEYFDAFSAAWTRLVGIVGEDRIILNRVYWSSLDTTGAALENSEESEIQNRHLDSLYSIIEKISPNIRWINYSNELVAADANHKWGPAPYHFGSDFYEAQRSALRAVISQPRLKIKNTEDSSRIGSGLNLAHGIVLLVSKPFSAATFKFTFASAQTVSQKNALLHLDLVYSDGSPVAQEVKIPGLAFSSKPGLGWFTYINTFSDITVWQKTISLPKGIRCQKAQLKRWGSDQSSLLVLDTQCDAN